MAGRAALEDLAELAGRPPDRVRAWAAPAAGAGERRHDDVDGEAVACLERSGHQVEQRADLGTLQRRRQIPSVLSFCVLAGLAGLAGGGVRIVVHEDSPSLCRPPERLRACGVLLRMVEILGYSRVSRRIVPLSRGNSSNGHG